LPWLTAAPTQRLTKRIFDDRGESPSTGRCDFFRLGQEVWIQAHGCSHTHQNIRRGHQYVKQQSSKTAASRPPLNEIDVLVEPMRIELTTS